MKSGHPCCNLGTPTRTPRHLCDTGAPIECSPLKPLRNNDCWSRCSPSPQTCEWSPALCCVPLAMLLLGHRSPCETRSQTALATHSPRARFLWSSTDHRHVIAGSVHPWLRHLRGDGPQTLRECSLDFRACPLASMSGWVEVASELSSRNSVNYDFDTLVGWLCPTRVRCRFHPTLAHCKVLRGGVGWGGRVGGAAHALHPGVGGIDVEEDSAPTLALGLACPRRRRLRAVVTIVMPAFALVLVLCTGHEKRGVHDPSMGGMFQRA